MLLRYEILGSAALVLEMSVVMVSTVVMPRATRAGAASRCSQNDTHDSTTIISTVVPLLESRGLGLRLRWTWTWTFRT